jgi:hypothetical protein
MTIPYPEIVTALRGFDTDSSAPTAITVPKLVIYVITLVRRGRPDVDDIASASPGFSPTRGWHGAATAREDDAGRASRGGVMSTVLRNDGECLERGEVRRRTPWQRVSRWMRGQNQPHDPYDVTAAQLHQLDEVLEVLAAARSVIEHGWVQDAWFAVRSRPQPGATPVAARARSSVEYREYDERLGACLVGAVVHAVRQRHPGNARAEVNGVGPVIDVVWDAWQESRGLGGAGVAGRVAPPGVRAARVRDLTRWNDQPDRRRGDVLALLELAESRTIMAAMTTPKRVTVGG